MRAALGLGCAERAASANGPREKTLSAARPAACVCAHGGASHQRARPPRRAACQLVHAASQDAAKGDRFTVSSKARIQSSRATKPPCRASPASPWLAGLAVAEVGLFNSPTASQCASGVAQQTSSHPKQPSASFPRANPSPWSRRRCHFPGTIPTSDCDRPPTQRPRAVRRGAAP